jgi:hypothetical protein
MELENRYFVIKLSDLDGRDFYFAEKCNCMYRRGLAQIKGTTERFRAHRGSPPLDCIVIEKDWPEYEAVLSMLSKRVDAEDNNP